MSNTLGKHLHHLCFSLIKHPQHHLTNPPKHNTKTHQHSLILPPPITTTTTATTTFTKTYNSLFENLSPASPSSASSADTDTDDPAGPDTPDLTAVYASRRFFISSPGRSNSIVDSRSSEEDLEPDTPSAMPAGGVAVETYSPDPYADFRRSMQEMMEAREVAREDVREVWHYLQGLLLTYLSLNPKSIHKYIVRAFADFVVSSMTPLNTTNNNNNNITINSNNGPSSSISTYFSSYYGITNYSNNSSTYVDIFDNAT